MSTVNGHPVLHYTHPSLARMEGLRIMFPKLVKPAPGVSVKGLHIANIKRNPDHPVDRGVSTNLIVQTCEFERVVVFENPSKLSLLFKCKQGDDKSQKFCEVIKALEDKVLAEIAGSPTFYPREHGKPADRFRPVLKEDEYQGRSTVEFRAEIPVNGDMTARDTTFFEMMQDGPVKIEFSDFKDKYKNRQCVAIVEFPYFTVMNSGSKAISIKPVVKQLLLMPEAVRMGENVRDNDTFRFMDM